MKKPVWKTVFAIYCCVMLWLLLLGRETLGFQDDYWLQVRNYLQTKPLHTIFLYLRVLDDPQYRMLAIVNLFGNIIMFLPLGFFLPLLWQGLRKWWKTWFLVLFIMTLIEVTQALTLRGTCDVDDLILNLLGAAMGYAIFSIKNRKPR